jgi:predicted DNA-binding protein (MmcQ/YjbR family)
MRADACDCELTTIGILTLTPTLFRIPTALSYHLSLTMKIDQLRKLCLSFPGATEQLQWGDDLLFKVGGKMFAITPLVPAPVWLTLKVSAEEFAELVERPGIVPAPYLARAKWVAIESPDSLPDSEVSSLLRTSYDLVVANLPARTRASLATGKPSPSSPAASRGKHPKTRRPPRRKRRG